MVNTDHSKGGPTLAEQLARIKSLPPSVLAQPTPFSYTFGTGGTGAINGTTGAPVFQPSIMYTDPVATNIKQTSSFVFHYNPSSLAYNTQWDTSITNTGTTKASSDTGGPVVDPLSGLPNVPETYSFDILLNRMVEASLYYANPFNNQLAQLFQTYGTICDLSLLYRTINGIQDSDIDAMVAAGLSNTVPATNRGFLSGTLVIVSLGAGNITFSGWVTGLSVTHAKFINAMTPVLTTVNVQFQRSLTAGVIGGTQTPAPGAGSSPDPTTGKVAKKWWQN